MDNSNIDNITKNISEVLINYKTGFLVELRTSAHFNDTAFKELLQLFDALILTKDSASTHIKINKNDLTVLLGIIPQLMITIESNIKSELVQKVENAIYEIDLRLNQWLLD